LRALASPLPITWVTADSAYGQDNRFRRLLEQSGVDYVLAVPKSLMLSETSCAAAEPLHMRCNGSTSLRFRACRGRPDLITDR
ncbi:transposase, partial [Streptomyces sp. NPDC056004]